MPATACPKSNMAVVISAGVKTGGAGFGGEEAGLASAPEATCAPTGEDDCGGWVVVDNWVESDGGWDALR